MNRYRRDIISLLSAMPDQAFDWIVLAISSDKNTKQPKIWPDELEGFDTASERSITHTRRAAQNYITAGIGHMFEKK